MLLHTFQTILSPQRFSNKSHHSETVSQAIYSPAPNWISVILSPQIEAEEENLHHPEELHSANSVQPSVYLSIPIAREYD